MNSGLEILKAFGIVVTQEAFTAEQMLVFGDFLGIAHVQRRRGIYLFWCGHD